jgi:hypothetical protein
MTVVPMRMVAVYRVAPRREPLTLGIFPFDWRYFIMISMDEIGDVAESASEPPAGGKLAMEKLEHAWRVHHADLVDKLHDELRKDSPGAKADEKLVLRLAAHDAAIGELLGDLQLQLARRIEAFIDQPKTAVVIARALHEVTGCRNAAARRAQELLLAAGTIRAQRRIGGAPHLQAVGS